jgi:hypothetical protein
MIREANLREGEVFVWDLDPDAEWAYSKFPAKLITVDYDKANRPIKIVAIGPEATRLQSAAADCVISRLRELAQTDIADEIGLVLACTTVP